jgi:hypothetical protein
MSGAIDAAPVGWLVGAPVEKLLKQLMLKEFESHACFTHGREIGGNFLRTVAGKNLRQLAVASFEGGQRGQGGTAKVLERIVCHVSVSGQIQRWKCVPIGFHSRDMDVNEVWQGVSGLGHCPSDPRPSPVGCGWFGEIS